MTTLLGELLEQGITHCRELADGVDEAMDAIDATAEQAGELAERVRERGVFHEAAGVGQARDALAREQLALLRVLLMVLRGAASLGTLTQRPNVRVIHIAEG